MAKLVFDINPAAASNVRNLSAHELHRVPDGNSAIDPSRSHLNRVLLGPRTQGEALEALFASGVERPTAQAESPYIQIVVGAGAEFFRPDDPEASGTFQPERVEVFERETLKWLKATFGDDLLHVSTHLDETTPHLHVLVAPTYQKAARKPGRRKRGETVEEFEARKREAAERPTVRTAGRASNKLLSAPNSFQRLRKSIADHLAPLGIEYGDDLQPDDPDPQTTRQHLKKENQKLKAENKRAAQTLAEAQRATLEAQREFEALRAAVEPLRPAVEALKAHEAAEEARRQHEVSAAITKAALPAFEEIWDDQGDEALAFAVALASADPEHRHRLTAEMAQATEQQPKTPLDLAEMFNSFGPEGQDSLRDDVNLHAKCPTWDVTQGLAHIHAHPRSRMIEAFDVRGESVPAKRLRAVMDQIKAAIVALGEHLGLASFKPAPPPQAAKPLLDLPKPTQDAVRDVFTSKPKPSSDGYDM